MTKREFLDTVFALAPNEANKIMDAFDEYVESNEPHWIPVTEDPIPDGEYLVTWTSEIQEKPILSIICRYSGSVGLLGTAIAWASGHKCTCLHGVARTLQGGDGMKRLICILMLSLLLAGCGKSIESDAGQATEGMFVLVESYPNFAVIADKNTGVMYSLSDGAYNRGTLTLLVDADGKPLIWER